MLDIPYREQFRYMQDWDQVLRMYESQRVEFCNCPEPLYSYFIRAKGVQRQPEYAAYNIFVRHCQRRRACGLAELGSLREFRAYLADNPAERFYWDALKTLIGVRLSAKRVLGAWSI